MTFNPFQQQIIGVLRGIVLAFFVATTGLGMANATVPQNKEKTQQSQPSAEKEKRININTATLTELDTLPRIGPAIGQRIIDFREKHGGFKKVEEIMNVSGIGEKTYARLKDLITVE